MPQLPEIIIDNPQINSDKFRRFSQDRRPHRIQAFIQLVKEVKIPAASLTACDLCCGDGAYAQVLIQMGVPASQVVCVDKCYSPTPMVKGVDWLYWDLEALACSLITKQNLPLEIVKYQHRYDIAVLAQGYIRDKVKQQLICEFFARRGGLIFIDNS